MEFKMTLVCLSDYKNIQIYINTYGYNKIKCMYRIDLKNDISILKTFDYNTCRYFNIPLKEYEKIILKNNGYHDIAIDIKDIKYFNFVFNSKVDCQNTINELSPYIVIKELIGDK